MELYVLKDSLMRSVDWTHQYTETVMAYSAPRSMIRLNVPLNYTLECCFFNHQVKPNSVLGLLKYLSMLFYLGQL